jgi:NAD(P)-dependent dehydrogenase (short-subunit alcohol dehydrogenase family)
MNTGGDMAELDGKVAIVTGSGRGIGEQVARRLSAAGARVVVNDLDGDEAHEQGVEVFRKVVNVTSLAGMMGNAGQVAHAAAKGTITLGVSDKARAGLATMIPLGRAASPEEAARGVYFLCSPESDYIHGQVLNVSGGLAVGMAG